MRRLGTLLVGLAAFAVVLFLGNPALSGEYHRGATLICYDCHNMHFSQSHGYNANGSGNFAALGSAGPYGYLLRNDINNLCLTCHDGQAWAPDVFEGPTIAGQVRSAGALNEVGGNGLYPPPTGHTLGYNGATVPGNSTGWSPDPVEGLLCTDCHNPHARGGPTVTNPYRNLQPVPAGLTSTIDPPSYVIGPANNLGMDVWISDAVTPYDDDVVNYNEPDTTGSRYGQWCGYCHNDFYGTPTSGPIGGSGTPPEHFHRHPVGGVDIGAVGGGHSSTTFFAWGGRSQTVPKLNWVKVMTSTGNWQPNDPNLPGWDYTPSCMTCHKAHGNQNAFGLIHMDWDASGGITEEGTTGGVYKDLCKQCHVQG